MKTNYGKVVEKYLEYTSDDNQRDPELRLGRMPAHAALGCLQGKCVLDFGCGPATNSRKLREAGAGVILGLDSDPLVIEKAREVDPQGVYIPYEGLLRERWGHLTIDAILMSFSFCVIPDREIRYILRDMREMLQEGGTLVIVEPNQEKAHGVQYPSLHYHRKDGVQTGDLVEVTLGSGPDAILLTDDIYRHHEDYCQLLEEAGFRIELMQEPVPDKSWGEGWELLQKYPPFVLIVAK
jgi:SAM-dependent methyltransferase